MLEALVALKVIHAGLGGWGSNWEVHPIPRVKDVERVAVVEPFEEPLRAIQRLLKLPPEMCFTDFEEALATVEADAVILTVPMEVHVPAAMTALRAGKHVLVEKPFAGTVAEAREAVDLADELGLILQVSQNYRFYPAVRTAARLVAEQTFGPVSTINIDFRRYANSKPDDNRHFRYIHPLLFDMAIHHFDLIRMVTGVEPVSVFAMAADPEWSKFRDEASATVLITLSNGVVVSYRGSWISTGAETLWGGDWHIECQDGEIHWTGRNDDTIVNDRVWLRKLGRKKETPIDLDSIGLHGRAGGLQAFVDAIRSGEEPENSGRRNLGSVALMEASAKSLASGKIEPVINPWT
ncbi:MAG: Gfo/Idh/MocA family oxidoreductase [Thermomicrobiales bacterium]